MNVARVFIVKIKAYIVNKGFDGVNSRGSWYEAELSA